MDQKCVEESQYSSKLSRMKVYARTEARNLQANWQHEIGLHRCIGAFAYKHGDCTGDE